MDAILTDLTPGSLARAVQANISAFFRSLQHSNAARFHTDTGLYRWHTDIKHPWFNGVLVDRPPAGDEAAAIQSTKDYYQSQGVPEHTWWLTPDQSKEAWGERLKSFGYRFSNGTPGMAIALSSLPDEIPTPAGFRIVPVMDHSTLQVWAHTFCLGYGLPESWAPDLTALFTGNGFSGVLRHYLGYLNGAPAAASSMFLGGGVAGIYNVGTLPAARRQGLGAALTVAPLREAQQMGYLGGILQSSEMGFPVYQRLGFQHLCQLELFYWSEANNEHQPD